MSAEAIVPAAYTRAQQETDELCAGAIRALSASPAIRYRGRRLGYLPFIFRSCCVSDYWRDDRDHHECERVFLDYSGTA